MDTRLARILDECLARISQGETVEQCLADYPDERRQLEPLLDVALSVSAIPRAAPSDEFKEGAERRLMMRLRREDARSGRKISRDVEPVGIWRRLWPAIVSRGRIALPVTIVLLLALTASLLLPGRFGPLSITPVMAAESTLSILGGAVEVQSAGSDSWQQGSDGMELAVGTRVKTAPDSHGLLTFFEGSTIKLEPDPVFGRMGNLYHFLPDRRRCGSQWEKGECTAICSRTG